MSLRRIGALSFSALFLALSVVVWMTSPRANGPPALPATPSSPPISTVQPTAPSRPAAIPAADETTARTKMLATEATTRLREWEDQDEPELRERRMQEIADLLAGADLAAVLRELPPDLCGFALGLPVFQRWMTGHPAEAAAWLETRPDVSEAHASTIVHAWTTSNPDGLREYLAQLPAGEWRQRLLATLSRDRLTDAPADAIAWALKMDDDAHRTGLLETAAAAWAQRDAGAAATWVNRVSPSALRDRLLGAIATGSATSDPAAAAQWLVRSLPPGPLLERSAAEVAGAWADRDPAASAQWVATFPAGEGQRMALDNLINVWGNRDHRAADAWAQALPEGPLHARAVALLAILPNRESTAPRPVSPP